jgi:hypothetical protein
MGKRQRRVRKAARSVGETLATHVVVDSIPLEDYLLGIRGSAIIPA